jgi:hypothetical protein
MRKPRKNDTPVEKVAILRRHRSECSVPLTSEPGFSISR